MSTAVEHRVKAKLAEIRKATGIDTNKLLNTLFLERFLVRISKSSYADKLIFKGGMCLNQFLNIRRTTVDIDFLARGLSSNVEEIKVIFGEIANIDANDGVLFSNPRVHELSLTNKKYPGIRIEIDVNLGQVKSKILIDLGIGDTVRARLLEVELMRQGKPIFEDQIQLNAYPPEYIFSEKYQAIISLAGFNSRMKDYYDCYLMIQNDVLDPDLLKIALKETFETRNTEFAVISSELVGEIQTKWTAFAKRENIGLTSIQECAVKINKYVKDLYD